MIEVIERSGPVEVRTDGRVPVKSWATVIEDETWRQARNLADLPFAISHVALMPDAHPGYGMPIGGVLFADKAIVPYAVGYDIGCGVALIETTMAASDLTPATTSTLLRGIARGVPVGNGPGGNRSGQERPLDRPKKLSLPGIAAWDAAQAQLGTLGGGNHFLELQADEDGRVWVMLHSGSRSLGHKICTHWHKRALEADRRWHSALPDPELAYLPIGTPEADGYFEDMTAALWWAEQNRRRMAEEAIGSIAHLGFEADLVLDVHHNYAAWERHGNRDGLVHRKGAVRANVGEVVLIPGSMGTASYVAEGLGNPLSFSTCQHGAGRARGRKATERMTNVEEMELAMGEIVLVAPSKAGVLDESPIAYKDIEDVMAASADLVRPVRRHRPLGVMKG